MKQFKLKFIENNFIDFRISEEGSQCPSLSDRITAAIDVIPESDFCYHITEEISNFKDSAKKCKELGGTLATGESGGSLATISNAEHQSKLAEYISSKVVDRNMKIWIGLRTSLGPSGKQNCTLHTTLRAKLF